MAQVPEIRVPVIPELDVTEFVGELSELKVSPFNVHVDICELLRWFEGDEQAMFGLLGKLKDFLA